MLMIGPRQGLLIPEAGSSFFAAAVPGAKKNGTALGLSFLVELFVLLLAVGDAPAGVGITGSVLERRPIMFEWNSSVASLREILGSISASASGEGGTTRGPLPVGTAGGGGPDERIWGGI
jgi:hypothetical protein